MKVEIGLLIAICSFGLSLVINIISQRRVTQEKGEKEGYELGVLTQKLNEIDAKLEKIEKRLDRYNLDIEKIVNDEIEKHVLKYHNGGE